MRNRPPWRLYKDGQIVEFKARPLRVYWHRFLAFMGLMSFSVIPAQPIEYNYKTGTEGMVSVLNSTSTPLGAGGSYTGSQERVVGVSLITIFAYADADSATGGLQMEFSTNGTDWERPLAVTVSSGSSEVHALVPVAQYFRVNYTNGDTAQTVFRLQVMYSNVAARGLVSRTSQVIDKDKDVDLVRVVNDPFLDTSRGLKGYMSRVAKFGRNPEVASSTTEDVWAAGGTIVWPSSGTFVRIKSGGNAADDPLGAGAAEITVEGLDENWASTSTVLTSSGAAASDWSTVKFSRVFRAYVSSTGVNANYTPPPTNVGAITIENADASPITVAQISADFGQTQLAYYTVPADRACYILQFVAQVSASKPADIALWQRKNANDATGQLDGAKRLVHFVDQLDGQHIKEWQIYPVFGAYTDVWVSATAGSGGAAAVSAEFDMVCVIEGDPSGDSG